jgi:hypothetical protein
VGYKRNPRIYRLIFEDGEYSGLIVRVRSMPLGQFLEIAALADASNHSDGEVEKLFKAFAGALVDWNLETDGPEGETWPVPADLDGLYDQDLEFGLFLIGEWVRAIGGVPDPLAGSSTSGGTSPVASLPMEVSSPNLGS